MEWTEDCEKYLLEILAERVKRDPLGAPIFKGIDWQGVDEQIFMKFARRYGYEKVKENYHRLRSIHTNFSELINIKVSHGILHLEKCLLMILFGMNFSRYGST